MNVRKLSRSEIKQISCGEDLRKYRNEQCLSQEYIANLLKLIKVPIKELKQQNQGISTPHYKIKCVF